MTLYILSGKYKGFKLVTPKRRETRPATSLLRGMVFDSCQELIDGARVLDLFSGSGAMGIEALSRGAAFVTFNDLSEECVKASRANLKIIGKENEGEVFRIDAFSLLDRLKQEPYDLILLHPPYPIGLSGYTRLIEQLGQKKHLYSPSTHLFLEIPGQLEKSLTLLIEKHFNIIKCKSRSTWALFHLTPLGNL